MNNDIIIYTGPGGVMRVFTNLRVNVVNIHQEDRRTSHAEVNSPPISSMNFYDANGLPEELHEFAQAAEEDGV